MAKKTLTEYAEENGKLKAENAALKTQLKAAKATTAAAPALSRDVVLEWVRHNLAEVAAYLRAIPGILPDAPAPTTPDPANPTAPTPEQGQEWLEGLDNKSWTTAVKASARKRSGLMAKLIANF